MRVSVVNFCSTAVDMLDFSSTMLLRNAGTDAFTYIVVTWNPSQEVITWLSDHKEIMRVDYHTQPGFKYVPNLRLMFNRGFDAGYEQSDWVAIVNTDMAFGVNWLVNLIAHAQEDIIPNSLHLSRIRAPNVVTVDLGCPGFPEFDAERFYQLYDELYQNKVETEEERGGWRACATMPYIVHRKWWNKCGPWEPEVGPASSPPDQRFFERCHDAGARFVLVHNSIVYHHEAAERRSGRRPVGIKSMREGR